MNTKFTRKGDRVSFKVSPEVVIAGRVAIPRDSSVDATVVLAKRGGLGQRKGEFRLAFDTIVLTDGTSLPLAAQLTRVGRWNRSNKITQTGPSDRNIWQDLEGLGTAALIGAALGDAIGGGKDAAIGGAAGAAIGILAIALERGPELDLPPGIMFQVELTKPLSVPVATAGKAELVASSPPPPPPPPQAAEPLADGVTPVPDTAKPQPDAGGIHKAEIPQPRTTVAASPRTTPSLVPVRPPADAPVAGNESAFQFRVDVNLVLVEATVRDERGAIYIKLKREDFLVLEDGVVQEILHFSRDELPLAVALVIDRSGSVAPVMDRLRRAAYETLSQLKRDDQVALFAFAGQTERLEDLTANRQAIADGIATIQAGGSTNIKDALFDASTYLGREAPARRHAIILISDNQETVAARANESEVIRTALETESVIYSIKVEDRSPLRFLSDPLPRLGSGPVGRITQETGGEIFNTKEMGSVESAMQAVISRLKLRFTLGYQSTNPRRDGAFRRIEVRLVDREPLTRGFTVYARRGYYAPKIGEEAFPPSSSDRSPAMTRPLPSAGRPLSAPEQEGVPSKPFTNDDVLKLVKAGFGEETTLEAIRTNECRFDTSADALLALKDAGTGEKIIMAILAAGRVSTGPAAPSSESDALPSRVGIYLTKDGSYIPLEFEPADWRPGPFNASTTSGDRTTATLRAGMATLESPLRLSGGLEFLLVCPEGIAEVEYHLLRAEDNKKKREFRAEFELVDDRPFMALRGTRKSRVPFTAKELAPRRFSLKLPQLGKGEYAFLPPTKGGSGKLYTFGVP